MANHDDIDAALEAQALEARVRSAKSPEDVLRSMFGAGGAQASPGGYTTGPEAGQPRPDSALSDVEIAALFGGPVEVHDDAEDGPSDATLVQQLDMSGSIPPDQMEAFFAAMRGEDPRVTITTDNDGEAVVDDRDPVEIAEDDAEFEAYVAARAAALGIDTEAGIAAYVDSVTGAKLVRELGKMTGQIQNPTPVQNEPVVPLLYIFSEDHGDREDCSIFYSRFLVVEPPPGGKAQVEAALDVILKRRPKIIVLGHPTVQDPDWSDPTVEAMVGPGGDVKLLAAELAKVGIRAWEPMQETMVDS